MKSGVLVWFGQHPRLKDGEIVAKILKDVRWDEVRLDGTSKYEDAISFVQSRKNDVFTGNAKPVGMVEYACGIFADLREVNG